MTSRPILLDTHAALWLTEGERFTPLAQSALNEAARQRTGIYLSPISIWEIGLLVAKERITLSRPPLGWADLVLSLGVEWAELGPAILVASSFLPGAIHADPADRILAATARALGLVLLTRDQKLLGYAAAGHMLAIGC